MIGNCLAHDSLTSVNTSRKVYICKYLWSISITMHRLFGKMSPTFVHGACTTAALWWVVGEILAGAIFFVDSDTKNSCTAV
jgi:hypothetical protein